MELKWNHPSLYKKVVFGLVEKWLHCPLLRKDHSPVFWNNVPMGPAFKEIDMMNIGEENLTTKEKSGWKRSELTVKITQALSLIMATLVLSKRRTWKPSSRI